MKCKYCGADWVVYGQRTTCCNHFVASGKPNTRIPRYANVNYFKGAFVCLWQNSHSEFDRWAADQITKHAWNTDRYEFQAGVLDMAIHISLQRSLKRRARG